MQTLIIPITFNNGRLSPPHVAVVTISNCNNFYRLCSRGYKNLPHTHTFLYDKMLVHGAIQKKFELDMCVVLVIDSMCVVVQYVSQMKVDIIFRFWLHLRRVWLQSIHCIITFQLSWQFNEPFQRYLSQ